MARALAIVADLMLGSRVTETLRAADHEVELVPAIAQASELERVDVIVADLDCEPAEALVGLGPPRRPASTSPCRAPAWCARCPRWSTACSPNPGRRT